MQTIGLIGGMSWESSASYYRLLNTGMRDRLGGLSSPKLVLSTVDFQELTQFEDEERWDQIGALLAEAAQGVERAGADFLLLCTTTFHKVADQVEAAVDIPLLHLADVVAEACRAEGMAKVGLIGTTVAMSEPFFIDRMASHGLEVIVPPTEHHEWLNTAIYEELVHGVVLPAHTQPRRGSHQRPLGRRRRWRAARVHRARAPRQASRRGAPALPVYDAPRDRRARPRTGLRSVALVEHQLGEPGEVTTDVVLRHRDLGVADGEVVDVSVWM